jgi:hypothetical protein
MCDMCVCLVSVSLWISRVCVVVFVCCARTCMVPVSADTWCLRGGDLPSHVQCGDRGKGSCGACACVLVRASVHTCAAMRCVLPVSAHLCAGVYVRAWERACARGCGVSRVRLRRTRLRSGPRDRPGTGRSAWPVPGRRPLLPAGRAHVARRRLPAPPRASPPTAGRPRRRAGRG